MRSNKLKSGLGAGVSGARTGSPLAVALPSQNSRHVCFSSVRHRQDLFSERDATSQNTTLL